MRIRRVFRKNQRQLASVVLSACYGTYRVAVAHLIHRIGTHVVPGTCWVNL